VIPHAPPARFPLVGDRVLLPSEHPLCDDGVYPALALVELAAQAAGHAVAAALADEARAAGADPEPHAGMLVEIERCTILRPVVAAGEVLGVQTRCERVMGPLRRYRVEIEGVLEVGLTLRIGAPAAREA
jgi:predicted hotdog family 3-hydroxylacyl-ACP dehydratase